MENLILDHLLSFFTIIITLIITMFSYKDILPGKPFGSFLIIISTFGFLISSSISFNLNLGRYFIILFYGVTSVFFFIKLKKGLGIYDFIKLNHKFIYSLLALGILSFVYLVYNLKINFLYNGHDPYFYGIPFEIIEGDYFTRIKIWDNYPLEWSKYHFFAGATYSIFLLFSGIKNIFLYKLIQLIFTLIGLFSLEEFLKNNENKNIYLYCLLLSLPIISWFFYTNGLLPLLFITGAIILYSEKKYPYSFLFMIFFSASLARHIIPGLLVSTLVFIHHHKTILKFKYFYLYFIPIINIFFMTFSGKSPLSHLKLDYFINLKFISGFLYGVWQQFLFLNYPFETLKRVFTLDISYTSFSIYISTVFFVLIFFKLNNFKHKSYLLLISLFLFIWFFFMNTDVNDTGRISEFGFKTKLFWVLHSIVFFLYPIYLFYYSEFKLKGRIKKYFSIFYGSSIFIIFLFDGGFGLPNYFFISIFCGFIILKNVNLKFYNFSIINILILIVIPSLLIPRIDEGAAHVIKMKDFNINLMVPRRQILNYESSSDTIIPILKSNIFGLKINNFKDSNELYHVTNGFIGEE